MKFKKFLLGVLVSTSVVGVSLSDERGNIERGIGQENSQKQVEISQEIKNLIQQIKQAPPEERYKYMNQLKLKIRELNQQERIKVVNQLREELHHKATDRAQHSVERIHNENTERYHESHQERQHNFMNRNDETQNRFMNNKEHENKKMYDINDRDHNGKRNQPSRSFNDPDRPNTIDDSRNHRENDQMRGR